MKMGNAGPETDRKRVGGDRPFDRRVPLGMVAVTDADRPELGLL